MSADRKAILRKIRACLHLSRSSNVNEAAAALRQAQKLMLAHGVDAATALDIDSGEAVTRQRGAVPPASLVALARLIADGFRCRVVLARTRATSAFGRQCGRTAVRFYGADGAAEVAVYAFTVLRRQLDADKQRHVRRCRKRIVKEQRAEVFALGWVAAVQALFPAAELTPERALAIDAAIDAEATSTGAQLGETTGRDVRQGRAKDDDRYAGYVAGKAARYHPGMKGSAPREIAHDGEVAS